MRSTWNEEREVKCAESRGRGSKVKQTLAALAITFSAKDPILFGSDLHFLPHRLTGTETYRPRLDVRWQVSFECIKPLTLASSVYLNLNRRSCWVVLLKWIVAAQLTGWNVKSSRFWEPQKHCNSTYLCTFLTSVSNMSWSSDCMWFLFVFLISHIKRLRGQSGWSYKQQGCQIRKHCIWTCIGMAPLDIF